MSATDELRRLLDERGMKYSDFTSAIKNGKAIFKTRWKHEGGYAELSEWDSTGSNNLFIQNVDPEQVIAATLGGGECENANDVMKSGEIGFKCSECGSWDDDPHPRFCHNCGKAVKQ